MRMERGRVNYLSIIHVIVGRHRSWRRLLCSMYRYGTNDGVETDGGLWYNMHYYGTASLGTF